MIKVLNTVKEKVKKYCLERFIDEVLLLDKESVIEEESVYGLPVITVVHPNKSKSTFCLRQYCFNDISKYFHINGI